MNRSINDSVLLIDKPAGKTSFEVIKEIKRRCRVKKIGHAGTLDMLASGLLVAATGRATKLVRYFMDQKKEYEAVISLGVVTDSYDRDGEIISRNEVTDGHFDAVQSTLNCFVGTIEQTPPVYSAVKINGKRASDRVRRGEQLELQSRQVTVDSIDVLNVDRDSALLTIRVMCSKGTYIRSLAKDLGEKLGCGASVYDLRRTKSGFFTVRDAACPDDFCLENESKGCISMDAALLPFMNSIIIDEDTEKRVLNGAQFARSEIVECLQNESKYSAVYNRNKKLVAIAGIDFNNWHVTYLNVFN